MGSWRKVVNRISNPWLINAGSANNTPPWQTLSCASKRLAAQTCVPVQAKPRSFSIVAPIPMAAWASIALRSLRVNKLTPLPLFSPANCSDASVGPVAGGAVTGGAVTEGAVTEGAVTEGAVTGGAVTGGAGSGGAVTGGAVTGGAGSGGAGSSGVSLVAELAVATFFLTPLFLLHNVCCLQRGLLPSLLNLRSAYYSTLFVSALIPAVTAYSCGHGGYLTRKILILPLLPASFSICIRCCWTHEMLLLCRCFYTIPEVLNST